MRAEHAPVAASASAAAAAARPRPAWSSGSGACSSPRVPRLLGHADDARRARVDPGVSASAGPLPVGRPLLLEGLRALLGVLGRRTPLSTAPPRSVGLLERDRQAAQHGLLRGLHRQRRVGADAARPTRAPGPCSTSGSTISLISPSSSARLAGKASAVSRNSMAAGNGELPGQARGRPAAGEQPPLRLHHAELGVRASRCGCRRRRASPCPRRRTARRWRR